MHADKTQKLNIIVSSPNTGNAVAAVIVSIVYTTLFQDLYIATSMSGICYYLNKSLNLMVDTESKL